MKSAIPKICTTIILFFIFFTTVLSQVKILPFQSEHSPRYWIDAAFFRTNENTTSVEVYYSIALPELSFFQNAGKYLASFTFSIEIIDAENNLVRQDSTARTVAVKSTEEASDKNRGIIDELIFHLPPGTYTLRSCLKDNHAQISALDNLTLNVPSFGNTIQTSSIQLASSISDMQTNKLFSKGGKSVMPNPSRHYRYHNSFLYVYYEVYNLLPPDSASSTFQYEYTIADSSGDSLIVTPPKSVQKPGTSCVKMQTLDIRGLESEKYLLSVKTTDPATGQSYIGRTEFYVSPPGPLLATRHLPMTPDDIKRYRDQIKYLASPEELKLYDQLAPEGKEKFVLNFWRSKDPTPETTENEYMQDYFSRIDYANKHFKGKDGGMNSDMGRVFIIYGQPDDIERHVMEIGKKPYIIWHYFTAGGQHTFVFVDRNQSDIYALVHSTVPEEIKNENWKSQELQ